MSEEKILENTSVNKKGEIGAEKLTSEFCFVKDPWRRTLPFASPENISSAKPVCMYVDS